MSKNTPKFTTAPAELLTDRRLKPPDKVIWLYLKYRQGQNEHTWPSIETIGKDVGVSEDTARRSVNRLARNDWLILIRPESQGRGYSNKYTVKTPTEPDQEGSKNATLSDQEGSKFAGQKGLNLLPELYTENYIQTFDDFWKAYPRKVSKKSAVKAWEKINPSEELARQIISAVERQKQTRQWQKNGGQFIPHPATWLNGERWKDEIPETVTTAPLERGPDGRTPKEVFREELERAKSNA